LCLLWKSLLECLGIVFAQITIRPALMTRKPRLTEGRAFQAGRKSRRGKTLRLSGRCSSEVQKIRADAVGALVRLLGPEIDVLDLGEMAWKLQLGGVVPQLRVARPETHALPGRIP
jgi:hypothetical protein